jgi:muramoyltetrapeptide carboxypeptidase
MLLRTAICWLFCLTAAANELSIVKPRALRPGDTICFVAPAGPLDKQRMDLARKRLEERGFKVTQDEDLYRARDYLAGSDARRAEELMAAFRDDDIDAIFPGTGGYGVMRMLSGLDFAVIRQHPKVLIGFSDITALHIALNTRAGLVTFHSPNPMWGLGSEDYLTPLADKWFWRALLAKKYADANPLADYVISPAGAPPFPAPHVIYGGVARGAIIGGNLSLVSALVGTPYEPVTKGKILLLEDVGEAPYRVDRMLCTLKLAGLLDNLSGAVLGQFTRRENEDIEGEELTINEVLDEYFGPLGIPVVRGFPLGHVRDNVTLPLGVECELNADRGEVRVLESPVVLSQ